MLSRLSMFRNATYILAALSVILAAALGYLVMRSYEEPDTQQPTAEQTPHTIT